MCDWAESGPRYVRTGWGRALATGGHDFRFWKRDQKSAFDAFSEFEPDWYIGTTYDLDRAIIKCIKARPNMKVTLFASAWGDLVDKLDRKEFPIVYVSELEKKTLAQLKKETGKPDYVFIHVSDKFLEPTMGNWRSIGIEPVGIMNGVDLHAFLGAQVRENLKCDIGFVGGYWPYKARNLDKYLLPLCDGEFDIKIFGNTAWPVAQWLGPCTEQQNRDLTVSARVCVNVSEPHSHLGFDLIERCFRVPAAGGLLVSDYVEEMKEVYGDIIPMAKTPLGMRTLIKDLVYSSERQKIIDKSRKIAILHNSYYNRTEKMLKHLKLDKEANIIMEKRDKHLQMMGIQFQLEIGDVI